MAIRCKPSDPLWLFTGLFTWFLHVSVALVRLEHPAVKSDGSISLLVVGDWGRRSLYNQSEVAFQMGKIGERMEIDFVISTGDNFYDDGLRSIDDPAFHESFSRVYTARSLQKQWYSVLGNHDYRGDVAAQLSPALRRIDERWLCLRSFILQTGIAEFFFVDTTPFVDKYFRKPNKHVYDWRGVLPREDYLSKLLKDLDLALRSSQARWKVVVGHHTIRSIGHHRSTKELGNLLLPILKANTVDMYINGHDHCLQHVSSRSSRIQFLTSGGGSKAWKGDTDIFNKDRVKFYYDGQGFMSMRLTETDMNVVFHDVLGDNLYHLNLTKPQQHSAV
ncbi:hypothetical protein SAY87_003639 [Trapa incisa]|uniref:Purple acid phosphatase n=1 Tax=Trapa incisa TaxID=236973 RepID=A0AAN7QJH1_9MYRT|nr:hypothetical protein SAY87_003639 [Trapa incisa]